MKITATSSIISWEIHGETMKAVTAFIFLGSKRSLQIVIAAVEKKKSNLVFGRKAMKNLDRI